MSEKGCLEIRLKPCMEVIENLIHFLNIYLNIVKVEMGQTMLKYMIARSSI